MRNIFLYLLILFFLIAKIGYFVKDRLEVRKMYDQLQQSEKALKIYSQNYFNCETAQINTLSKFIANHDLKVQQLLAKTTQDQFKLINDWDKLKKELEHKLEDCKASVPTKN